MKMFKWRIRGTKRGKPVTVEIEAPNHNAAVRKASSGKGYLIVVRDCVLID